MSHVAAIAIECRDLDALRVAVEQCGGELVIGQETHAWWGDFLGDSRGMKNSAVDQGRDPKTFGTCSHAIRVKGKPGVNGPSGPWEVGVCANRDAFDLVYDNFGGAGRQLESAFGKDLVRIKDELAAEVTMRQLSREGYRLSRSMTSEGAIVLTADR